MSIKITKPRIDDIPVLEVVEEEKALESLPLVIYYHGWQTSKELVLTQGRKLAERGFRVCLPDAPNHGERRQEVSSIPSLTYWSSIHGSLFEYEKLRDFFLTKRNSNGKVSVGGVSMGGMTICSLLTHHPEITAAACVMGTPSPTAFKETTVSRMKEFGTFLPSDYLDLLSWTDDYDLALHPELLSKRPLFFWHGTEDWKIPIDSVVQFVEANRQAPHGRNIQLHIGLKEAHLVKVPTMDKVAEFFVEMQADPQK